MQRAKSGSPPPWAHKFGPNAVFRPALGLGGPSAYPGNRSTPEPQLAPHKPPLHMPSPDRAAVRQRATPEPVRAPSEPSRKDSDAQARQQGPEQVLNKQRATPEPARGLKKAPHSGIRYAGDSSIKGSSRPNTHASLLSVCRVAACRAHLSQICQLRDKSRPHS